MFLEWKRAGETEKFFMVRIVMGRLKAYLPGIIMDGQLWRKKIDENVGDEISF